MKIFPFFMTVPRDALHCFDPIFSGAFSSRDRNAKVPSPLDPPQKAWQRGRRLLGAIFPLFLFLHVMSRAEDNSYVAALTVSLF